MMTSKLAYRLLNLRDDIDRACRDLRIAIGILTDALNQVDGPGRPTLGYVLYACDALHVSQLEDCALNAAGIYSAACQADAPAGSTDATDAPTGATDATDAPETYSDDWLDLPFDELSDRQWRAIATRHATDSQDAEVVPRDF